jgi:hypothetical protein
MGGSRPELAHDRTRKIEQAREDMGIGGRGRENGGRWRRKKEDDVARSTFGSVVDGQHS